MERERDRGYVNPLFLYLLFLTPTLYFLCICSPHILFFFLLKLTHPLTFYNISCITHILSHFTLISLTLPHTHLTLQRCPLSANQTIHSTLAKGAPRHLKASVMYTCKTCNLKTLCRSCTIMCHAQHGHVIGARPFNSPRQLCQCGLGPCGLLLCIVEHTPVYVNSYSA